MVRKLEIGSAWMSDSSIWSGVSLTLACDMWPVGVGHAVILGFDFTELLMEGVEEPDPDAGELSGSAIRAPGSCEVVG